MCHKEGQPVKKNGLKKKKKRESKIIPFKYETIIVLAMRWLFTESNGQKMACNGL
jgi:hypothetical protein